MLFPGAVQCRTQNERNLLGRIVSYYYQSLQYKQEKNMTKALSVIDIKAIQEGGKKRFEKNPKSTIEDETFKSLLHWFKMRFFGWTTKPRCPKCNHNKVSAIGRGPPTEYEKKGLASIVEIYKCRTCNGIARFPRYNHCARLLETKTGRCGEWAQCFCLIASSLSYDCRYVIDWTDHVWVEVYSKHLKRWVHCDVCENQWDKPRMYEKGWKKKLTYVIAFNHEQIVDVTRRYSVKYDEVLNRRKAIADENWVKNMIKIFNGQIGIFIVPKRKEELMERNKVEIAEFEKNEKHGDKVKISEAEKGGRISGDTQWKERRGEFVSFLSDNYRYILFETGNVKGIKKKILKFSKSVEKIIVSEEEITSLLKLYEDRTATFDDKMIELMDDKLLKFPVKKLFPNLDVLRLLLLNENVWKWYLIKEASFIEMLLKIFGESKDIYGNQLIILRVLSNLFVDEMTRKYVGSFFIIIYNAIKILNEKYMAKREYKIALSSLIYNFAKIVKDEKEKIMIVVHVVKIIERFNVKDDRERLIKVLGMCSYNNQKIKKYILSSGIMEKLKREKICENLIVDLENHCKK